MSIIKIDTEERTVEWLIAKLNKTRKRLPVDAGTVWEVTMYDGTPATITPATLLARYLAVRDGTLGPTTNRQADRELSMLKAADLIAFGVPPGGNRKRWEAVA